MFAIGDKVWRATWDSEKTYIACLECGGTKHVRVTLFDGTEHTIDCAGCSGPHNLPSGVMVVYNRTAKADPCTIKGIKIENSRGEEVVEYVAAGTYTYYVKADVIFSTEEEAIARAQEMSKQADEEDRQRIFKKEQDKRTWSWNVHYYRSRIRRSEKDIAYYTSKLNVAKPRAAEERALKKITRAEG